MSELSQETLLIAAKKVISDYAEKCSNIDEGNLFFAATQYQSAFDKAILELKVLRNFLDEDIASLECNSRIRTMDEDTWSAAMYLRDHADLTLKDLGESNG